MRTLIRRPSRTIAILVALLVAAAMGLQAQAATSGPALTAKVYPNNSYMAPADPLTSKNATDGAMTAATYTLTATIAGGFTDADVGLRATVDGAATYKSCTSCGSITAGLTSLTVTTAGFFASTDVGRHVTVAGAGAAGGTLATTICAWTSGTQVDVCDPASTTKSGGTTTMGTLLATTISAVTNAKTVTLAAAAGITVANAAVRVGDHVPASLTGNVAFGTNQPSTATFHDAPGALMHCAASKRIASNRCLKLQSTVGNVSAGSTTLTTDAESNETVATTASSTTVTTPALKTTHGVSTTAGNPNVTAAPAFFDPTGTDVGKRITITGAGSSGSTLDAVITSTNSQGTAATVAVSPAVTTSAQTTTVFASAFAPGTDEGKRITIPGAGASGATLDTSISSITNSGKAVLAASASLAVAAATATIYKGFFLSNDAPIYVTVAGAGAGGSDLDTKITTYTNRSKVTVRDAAATAVGPAALVSVWGEDAHGPSPVDGDVVATLQAEGDFNVGFAGASMPCGDVDSANFVGLWDDPFQNPVGSTIPRGAVAEIKFPTAGGFSFYGYLVPSGTDPLVGTSAVQTGQHWDLVANFPLGLFACPGSSISTRLILQSATQTRAVKTVTGVAMSSGSSTATASGTPFNALEDVGRTIVVPGAGPGGADLQARISSVPTSDSVTLVTCAGTTTLNTNFSCSPATASGSVSGVTATVTGAADVRENPSKTGTTYLKLVTTTSSNSTLLSSASYSIDQAFSAPSS